MKMERSDWLQTFLKLIFLVCLEDKVILTYSWLGLEFEVGGKCNIINKKNSVRNTVFEYHSFKSRSRFNSQVSYFFLWEEGEVGSGEKRKGKGERQREMSVKGKTGKYKRPGRNQLLKVNDHGSLCDKPQRQCCRQMTQGELNPWALSLESQNWFPVLVLDISCT